MRARTLKAADDTAEVLMTPTAAHTTVHTFLEALRVHGLHPARQANEGLLPTGAVPLGHGLIDQGATVTFTVALRGGLLPCGPNGAGHHPAMLRLLRSACSGLDVTLETVHSDPNLDPDGNVRLQVTTTRPAALTQKQAS